MCYPLNESEMAINRLEVVTAELVNTDVGAWLTNHQLWCTKLSITGCTAAVR